MNQFMTSLPAPSGHSSVILALLLIALIGAVAQWVEKQDTGARR